VRDHARRIDQRLSWCRLLKRQRLCVD
jgi:hypothetical protein